MDRRMFVSGGVTAAAILLAPRVSAASFFPIVETAQGKVRGLTAGGVHMFKGLRYGASTAGANRFRRPAPPPKWVGVQDAFNYGQVAPQIPNSRQIPYAGLISFDIQPGGMGEDCLVLNVWTPTLDRGAKRPVLIHIHGGGFYGGSGNSAGFDGEEMARFGKCVVITINHRLGAFGYLDLAGLDPSFADSGRAGMLDIVAALRWVRENAEGFGGDPGRVLVFGQSGGGAKTSTLLSMPSAKGLFHRAGVMSGALLKLNSSARAQEAAPKLLETLGMAKAKAGDLQKIPFSQLLEAQAAMEAADRAKGEAPRSFSPSIDGTEIPANPFDPVAPAISADIPIIVSTVLDERAYRMLNYGLDEKGLLAGIAMRVGAERAPGVLAMYRKEDPSATPFVLQARFGSDEYFRKSAWAMSERKAAQGAAPVWNYLWRMPSPAYGGRYGAPHGIDVGPSLHDVRGGLNTATPEMVKLADQLASAWVAFAETGNPNNPKLPEWPAYTVPRRATLVLDRETRVEDDPRAYARKFWEKEPSTGV